MAYWISNKLKVAETFLQQIDQQAADSLGKGEKPRSDDLQIDAPSKSSGSIPLKDQLKKKTHEINDYRGKVRSDPTVNIVNRNNSLASPKESKSKTTLTDSDWTELLGTPRRAPSLGNVKEERRQGGTLGSRNRKSSNNHISLIKSAPSKVNGGNKPSDGEESGSSERSSSVELQSNGKNLEGQGVKPQDSASNVNVAGKNSQMETVSVSGNVDTLSDVKIGLNDIDEQLTRSGRGNHKSYVETRTSVPNDSKRGSASTSEDGSDSDSGSSSESESEREREERRRLREKILAERAAAKAVEAIKERENMVAKLEGEKQSLEKILEERAKQQVKEASELQTSMIETMEAVELEKQRHNNTRMEALAQLAKLETANADIARALAYAQKKLEVETSQVVELRQQIELKEVIHEELSKRISNTHHTGLYLKHVATSKGMQFEQEILETEYSFMTDKLKQLEDKAKRLEGNVEMTRKEIEDPTEIEIELKQRLGQLTDHLIQKQAQVEALSSEKATLAFRIEAVSRLLDENKSMTGSSSKDLESGAWNLSQSHLRPLLEDKIRNGREHIGSLVMQLDSIFLAGAVFLRRNPIAKLWSFMYLICLHFWVIYILLSHSWSSDEARSGAVFSLENINNTASL